jgi:cellobiose transport system permease protein
MSAATDAASRAPRSQSGATRKRRRSTWRRSGGAGPVAYTFLIVATLVSLFPLYWVIILSSHTNSEMAASPPPLLPKAGPLWSNMKLALHNAPLLKAIFNTIFVASFITIGAVLFCTAAGFAFAKLRFRGRNILMGFVIGTLAVPTQLAVIPLFIFIAKLHWQNHLQAVIFPSLANAFGVFFMRQYLVRALPTELIESGWVDGASTFRIFRSIVMPIARPAMAVFGMLVFLAAWNDFFWPIIALSTRNPTVQVSLANLQSGYVPQTAIIMAATLIGTLPILAVFTFLGRQIVSGVMQGAIKG